jgi:hypothetical protein
VFRGIADGVRLNFTRSGSGAAYVYMQEFAADDPGRCYAILARPGEIVVVPTRLGRTPPSAPDPASAMTFGALCDREYGFEYAEVRQRRGPGLVSADRFCRRHRLGAESRLSHKPRGKCAAPAIIRAWAYGPGVPLSAQDRGRPRAVFNGCPQPGLARRCLGSF